ncbi:MAG: hypothetical protein V4509_01725 [Patescibacteria group bacterium]
MTIRRIILKIVGKTPDHLKVQIRSLGGYWDDLFDAWNLPIECAELLGNAEQFKSHSIKEVLLPKELVTQPNRERAMHSKYATLTQKLRRDEDTLLKDIDTYERHNMRVIGKYDDGRDKYDTPNCSQMYEDAPTPEGKSKMCYQVESNLHHRFMEIRKMRAEIQQINLELKQFEDSKKGWS